MKIFNWMHGYQFSYNHHSSIVCLNGEDKSSGNTRRSNSPIGTEKAPLLDQDLQMIESWEFEGILAIGTLSIDPLNNFQDEEDDKDTNLIQEPESEIAMFKLRPKQKDAEGGCIKEEIVEEKITKRVTLLDLFLADELRKRVVEKEKPGDADIDDDYGKNAMETRKKANLYSKLPNVVAGKKNISSKANFECARPIKKMQRFMTRLMKRKIHPDMEARLQNKAQGYLNDDVLPNDSASLLPDFNKGGEQWPNKSFE